jgi:hypothetical protein
MFVKKHGKITNNYNTTHGIYLKFSQKRRPTDAVASTNLPPAANVRMISRLGGAHRPPFFAGGYPKIIVLRTKSRLTTTSLGTRCYRCNDKSPGDNLIGRWNFIS